eukprot:5593337-Prymnesium_polylepis.1
MSTTPPPCSAPATVEYLPSPWELAWRKRVTSAPDRTPRWERLCDVLRNETAKVAAWLDYSSTRKNLSTAADAAGWSPAIFSYHRFVDGCSGAELHRLPIEPLVSFLRHPAHTCFNRMRYKYSRGYLLPSWRWEADITRTRAVRSGATPRSFLFDLGASLYSQGLGGASQKWFVEGYQRRGITFDRGVSGAATQTRMAVLVICMSPLSQQTSDDRLPRRALAGRPR